MKQILPVLLWPLGYAIGLAVVRLLKHTPWGQFRQALHVYWPAVHFGLWCQVASIITGVFLFQYGIFSFVFLALSFCFWCLVPILLCARPRPSMIERVALSAAPAFICSLVYFVELHHAA